MNRAEQLQQQYLDSLQNQKAATPVFLGEKVHIWIYHRPNCWKLYPVPWKYKKPLKQIEQLKSGNNKYYYGV